ncbi:MAG: ROK family protein [Nakamurella sp.]
MQVLDSGDPADSLIAALDVGGTVIKAGLVARDGTVHHSERHATSVRRGPEALIESILTIAENLARHQSVRAVGLGVPGIVDSAAGVAHYAANLGWKDVPFTALLQDRLGIPAVLGHDVRNGALAEARLGAGIGIASVYFLAIGTGVAGGQVSGGIVDDGSSGQAGEIGHLVVRPRGPHCGCGNRGCLEAIASASRIAATYRRRSRKRGSAADVARLVEAGDEIANAVWSEAVAALADALAAQVVLADPGCIVIGGGLSLAGPTLFDPLREALPSRLTFRSAPPIMPAKLGDRAGMVGAALRTWDALA